MPLTTRQQLPTLAYRAVKTLRVLPCQVDDASQFRHFEHARIADIACAQRQVVAQAASQKR